MVMKKFNHLELCKMEIPAGSAFTGETFTVEMQARNAAGISTRRRELL
jgi:hypothetical protein